MKSPFSLIAATGLDACLEVEDSCHVCFNAEAYNCLGEIIEEGYDADYLCSTCILELKTKRYTKSWERTLSLCDYEVSLNELLRSPDLPCFIQEFDWPVCCGRLCLFTGMQKTMK